MRTLFLLVGLIVLAGCARRAQILEREYGEAATTVDRCRIAGQIASIYLERSNAKQYEMWSLTRDSDCLLASEGIYTLDLAVSKAADKAISDAENSVDRALANVDD